MSCSETEYCKNSEKSTSKIRLLFSLVKAGYLGVTSVLTSKCLKMVKYELIGTFCKILFIIFIYYLLFSKFYLSFYLFIYLFIYYVQVAIDIFLLFLISFL